MTNQHYGQFCGLARAAEIVGQRWTLLILRDLTVAPQRYSDLVAGLPGIPTNTLASRLKDLEEEGLVERVAPSGAERSVTYRLTPRGEELGPALDALSRWGAGGMRTPRDGAITVAPGPAEKPDLVITAGPQIRDVLAGELDAQTAVETGVVQLEGDASLFQRFADTMRVPYSPNVPATV
jgi:DNA-binding HxlR family transcriptional regulator